MYDSTRDTQDHIAEVRKLLVKVMAELTVRHADHDETKLKPPEKEAFDVWTPRLREMTYESPEYQEARRQLAPALEHHYKHNRHHPEHFVEGIRGMHLVDLIEMVCDWKAATMRHADGDILSSVEKNQKRYGYSDELKQILKNTVEFISD